ncbi:MAG TPA: hypothetical protein VFV34_26980, partial [Blastocatellia bacterium]|nr:hypothetical protein [Blastocatellia bacterium]
MARANYTAFKLFRLAVPALTIMLLILAQGWTSSADQIGSSVGGPDAESLKACWMKHVDDHGAGCFEVKEGLENEFSRLIDSWRLAQSSHPGLEIRSVEYRENNRVGLLLAGETAGIAVVGPVSIGVETSSEGRHKLVSIDDSPSSPPVILVISVIVNILYIFLGLALLRRLKRDPQ